MRALQFIIILFMFATCKNVDKENKSTHILVDSKKQVVTLVDSLGKVTFSIPNRFDTSFVWTHHSDCGKPCDIIKYRFQPKYIPIFKESGFFYRIPECSIDQFTIEHSGYFPFRLNTDTSWYIKLHESCKGELNEITSHFLSRFDTIETINDRKFSLIAFEYYDSLRSVNTRIVSGATSIRGNDIKFVFKQALKFTDSTSVDFLKKSLLFLRTIKLSNGI